MPDQTDAVTRSGLPLVVGAFAALSFAGFAELAIPSLAGVPGAGTTRPAPGATAVVAAQSPPAEIVVYAAELPRGALSEFAFRAEAASPGGKFAVTPNTGDYLDPPPENDPHVKFQVPVQAGVPYRCWIHMKVGTPKGVSKANLFWVQFSNAVDQANRPVLKPGTSSYLTARGPERPGWAWVACDQGDAPASEALVTFNVTGEVTVRMQAGMEGVGFDQFVLSPARFLKQAPTEAVVGKS
jgi:hypothetical protein